MISIRPAWLIRAAIFGVWAIIIGSFLWAPALMRAVFPDRSLKLLALPTMIDAHVLTAFEKATGSRVHVTYYESNEELLRKLRSTAAVGYDLIIASDYVVELLIREQLLKKIDRTRLTFFNELYPALRNHYFDPGNDYSIPYYFGVYGLGIDTNYFGGSAPQQVSWALLFEPKGYRVTMTDDPRRAVLLAGYYVFGSTSELNTPDRLAAIKKLLLEQKKSVELYSDIRGEETLVARSCPVALTISADLWRVQREYGNLSFAVPQEGSFMTIDSLVISHATEQENKVYALLEFLYRHEHLRHHASKYGFCPPLNTVDVEGYGLLCPHEELIKKLQFFRSVIPKAEIDALWISVMAK